MTQAQFIAEHADFYDYIMGEDEAQDIIEDLKQQAQWDWEVEQD